MAAACQRGAFGAACGRDTALAIEKAGVASAISHISTGSSAALEFIAGHALPGLTALAN
jgi:phosphoglycerate kinase